MPVKTQLNVSFASPLESCRLYTPSPSLSMASTLDIPSETDMCESNQEILNHTASSTNMCESDQEILNHTASSTNMCENDQEILNHTASSTNMCENDQEILNHTASSTDMKSDNKPFDACDTRDQRSTASQDNYSDPAVHIAFSTSELKDSALSSVKNWTLRDAVKVESSLDQVNVISGQMNRISARPATVMSEKEVESSTRENYPSEERSRTELRGNDQL